MVRAVFNGGADAFASFGKRFISQADDIKSVEANIQVDLHVYQLRVNSLEFRSADSGKVRHLVFARPTQSRLRVNFQKLKFDFPAALLTLSIFAVGYFMERGFYIN